jgi:hypothetical protein
MSGFPVLTANLFNVQSGTGNDAAAVTAAYNAALAAGGGVVSLPDQNLVINTAAGIVWGSGLVQLRGLGSSSVLIAGPLCTTAVLTIAVGASGGGLFEDFVVDANAIAANAIVQSIVTETSVGTRFVRVQARNATSFQWVNNKCEDCTYLDCFTPGNESIPLTVKRSMQFNIPSGMCRVLGGELYGRHDLNCQQMTYDGTVFGPVTMNGSAASLLSLQGCYVYDGGIDNNICVDTAGNLFNLEADGTVFIANVGVSFTNGNIAAGVTLSYRNCQWVQGTATGVTINLVHASGSGSVVVDGGTVTVNNAVTVNAFFNVGGATTFVQVPNVVTGVTASPAHPQLLNIGTLKTINSTIDDGSGDLIAGGYVQAGGAGVKMTNSGALQFLTTGGGSLWGDSGAPAAGLGSNGDYYLRSDGGVTSHIYFKATGSWAGII